MQTKSLIDEDTVTLVLAQLEMLQEKSKEVACEAFTLGIETSIEVVSWLKERP
jgi:hypothetical protein